MPDETPKRYPPKRVVRVDLTGEWEGFHVTAWVNADQERRRRFMAPTTEEEVLAGAAEIILEHDLTDFEGDPLPPAGQPGFFERMPADAYNAIRRDVNAQFGRLSPPSALS